MLRYLKYKKFCFTFKAKHSLLVFISEIWLMAFFGLQGSRLVAVAATELWPLDKIKQTYYFERMKNCYAVLSFSG
jgi:hypothetical protein